jgi:hypothetical protein
LAGRALWDEPPFGERFQLPAVIAIAVVGGAFGVWIISIGGLGPKSFTDTGKFDLWLFLIAVQTALWALGAGLFLLLLWTPPLVDVARQARATAWLATAAVAVPVLGFVAAAGGNLDYPLPGHEAKVKVLSFIGAGIALIGVFALGRVYYALRHERLEATKDGIESYLELRAVLERVLAVEGAIIGAAILASGALRNLVIASNSNDQSAFPKEHLLLYGAYFSLVLAVVYAPIYQRLLAAGRRLIDDACPAEDPGSDEWTKAYDKRKKLEELLGLDLSTTASFRAAVAITTPLVASIVGLLLGKS